MKPYEKAQKVKYIGPQDRRRKLTDEQRAEVLRIRQETGAGYRTIARQFGVSRSLVRLICDPEAAKRNQERMAATWRKYREQRAPVENAKAVRDWRRRKYKMYIANELTEKYPDRKAYVVDTLCASLGQGLLVWYACQKRDQGCSLEALRDWVEENKQHLCHWFTVDDLMHLKRGGRISATTALVGTMLQIKPVLHVDDEGHLVNVSKARGRKASIDALAKKVKELGEGYDNSTMFISHGDCYEDAEYLANILKTRYGAKEVMINYVGAVIGSHAGPGTLALFFLGDHR